MRAVLRATRAERRKARPTAAANVKDFFLFFMGVSATDDTGVFGQKLARECRFACAVRAGNNDAFG